MAQVVLPNTITDGTAMEATEVQGNDEALRDGVNNIDRTQIAAGEIHAGLLEDGAVVAAKIGTGAVTNPKVGAAAITNDKITDGTIEAAKLASTIQILVHKQWEVTIADEANDFNDFTGLATTLTPQTQVYIESGVAGEWLAHDPKLADTTDTIVVTCSWAGANWRVQINNDSDGPRDFMVVVSGESV